MKAYFLSVVFLNIILRKKKHINFTIFMIIYELCITRPPLYTQYTNMKFSFSENKVLNICFLVMLPFKISPYQNIWKELLCGICPCPSPSISHISSLTLTLIPCNFSAGLRVWIWLSISVALLAIATLRIFVAFFEFLGPTSHRLSNRL